MELLNLKIENFCSVGLIDFPLNQPGLILVTGVNKDAPNASSNGSGKSALLEGLCWCLWGETIRGLASDEVVNTLVGKDCAVTLTLAEQGATYTISRHRQDTRTKKPNDLVVLVNEKPLNSSKIKSTQEVINQLVGFDFDTFRAMMPGAGIRVASLTDKAVKELLEALLQTEQLSEAHEVAKAKQKDLETRIAKAQAALTSSRAQLAAIEVDLDHQLKLAQQVEANAEQRRATHRDRIAVLSAEIASAAAVLAQEPALTQTLADLKQKVTQVHVEQQDVERPLNNQVAIRDTLIQELTRKEAVLLSQREDLRKALKDAESLPLECESCFQPISAVRIADVVRGKVQSLERVNAQISETRSKSEEYAAQNRKTQKSLEGVHITYQAKIAKLQIALTSTTESLWAIKFKRSEHDKAVLAQKREQTALKDIDLEVYDFKSILDEKLKAALDLVDRICKLLTLSKQASTELKLCSFWVSGFSPAGLRSFMLDYVTPILNDRAKYYADLLTNQEMSIIFSTKSVLKNGTSKDKFSIEVSQAHGAGSYVGSSAGERARADLVIAMALGDLAQLRTAKQLLWRFLDEPFESIDSAGTEAIVKLLNDQKSRYKTVFVVTHKADFKEMFSQSITVVKENGISSLDTAL